MIKWDIISYDIGKASKDFASLSVESKKINPIEISSEFEKLRQELLEARDEIYDQYEFDAVNKLDYKFDLVFGLKVYEILNEAYGFTNRVASNDDVWRFLSIKIIPDIVHSRQQFKEEYFYKKPRRIWLKTIWWYIHLSWQGNQEETFEILKNNTTDTIMRLVDRSGIGYNVELYREIMRQYVNYKDNDRSLFRRILKLNVARVLTVAPELFEDGIKGYVESLYETVE
ncbi:DUF6339 family protein [Staphylococcus pseudintermedius]|nr:DUF6339 family protein [Staphylococcus pseudintermedius]UAS74336.1 DUF6339 family protein [Staphylococcus pseudintermedius]